MYCGSKEEGSKSLLKFGKIQKISQSSKGFLELLKAHSQKVLQTFSISDGGDLGGRSTLTLLKAICNPDLGCTGKELEPRISFSRNNQNLFQVFAAGRKLFIIIV